MKWSVRVKLKMEIIKDFNEIIDLFAQRHELGIEHITSLFYAMLATSEWERAEELKKQLEEIKQRTGEK